MRVAREDTGGDHTSRTGRKYRQWCGLTCYRRAARVSAQVPSPLHRRPHTLPCNVGVKSEQYGCRVWRHHSQDRPVRSCGVDVHTVLDEPREASAMRCRSRSAEATAHVQRSMKRARGDGQRVAGILDEPHTVDCGAWRDGLQCPHEDQAPGIEDVARAGRRGQAARL
ncbi:hypothetical protein NKDENANG_03026 [Candidatus Entotheonellaceae bacterium PAL068K]